MRLEQKEHCPSSGGDGDVHSLNMYTNIKTYQIVHFKCVQFVVGQLYLSKDI